MIYDIIVESIFDDIMTGNYFNIKLVSSLKYFKKVFPCSNNE